MERIYEHFSKTVDDYDTVARNVVYRNDEIHQVLVDSIPFPYGAKLKILDLGSGTGYGIRLIGERFPKSVITGIDFSPIMIKKSKENLVRHLERVNLREEDFRPAEFGDNYDVIVSIITIHNITNVEKEKLFEKVFTSLKPGGVFVNGDFYAGETEPLDQDLRKLYEEFLRKNLKGDELKVWLRHALEEDMPMKLSEQFSLLNKVGFKKIELKWLYNNEALYMATK